MFFKTLSALAKIVKPTRGAKWAKKLSRRPQLERLEDRQLLSHGLIPHLDSNSGAAHTLYLDFDGFRVGPSWRDLFAARPAFDMDGDASTFTADEAATIQSIWTYVAEDFAPFNINVTTAEPAAGKFLRVIIGGMDPNRGDPSSGVTTFDHTHDYNDEDHPRCYVYSAQIAGWFGVGARFAQAVAGTASHEAGHVLYLGHLPDWERRDGRLWRLREYGVGDAFRTPIMGNNLADDRVIWARGLNVDRDRQNDVATLTSVLGLRADEANNDFSSAQRLTSLGAWMRDGVFEVTGPGAPLLGRYESFLVGSGIIGDTGDVDYFRFTHATGPLLVQVNTLGSAANLDAQLELYRRVGGRWEWVATQDAALTGPFAGLDAEVRRASLPGGEYIAVVRSHGDYGDLGHYTITATVTLPPDAPQIASIWGPRWLSVPGGTRSFGIHVSFTETIDTRTFTASDVVFAGPEGAVIPPLRVHAFPGHANFIIVLPELTAEGRYRLEIGPNIQDVTGDPMNQDGDYDFGEPSQDQLVRTINFRLPPPSPTIAEVAAAFPRGGLPAHLIDLVLAHWDIQNLLRGLPPTLGGPGRTQAPNIIPNALLPKPVERSPWGPPIQLGGPQPDPPGKGLGLGTLGTDALDAMILSLFRR